MSGQAVTERASVPQVGISGAMASGNLASANNIGPSTSYINSHIIIIILAQPDASLIMQPPYLLITLLVSAFFEQLAVEVSAYKRR